MNNIDNNIKSIPKLLRVIANSDSFKNDDRKMILTEAAKLIEHLAQIRLAAKNVIAAQRNK